MLGSVDAPAGAETALYAPAINVLASVKVIVANRTQAPALVRVIHRAGVGPTVAKDFKTFDEVIPGNDSRVSPVFDMENPEELLVQSNVSGVTFQADGIERT